MVIVLNHKMNLNIDEIKAYEKSLRDYNVIVMPQTPYMGLFSKGKYILGSQCISEYTATGGISAESLIGMNVKYVMVGHAERRLVRQEDDEVIAQKINEIIDNNMTPIMCIGEMLAEKEAGYKEDLIAKQISNVFSRLTVPYDQIIVAYEPVWSIGTNQTPDINEIESTLTFIKNHLKEKYNSDNLVLYGGSINSNNIKEIKHIKCLDGIIIGSASLDIQEVIKIYNIINT